MRELTDLEVCIRIAEIDLKEDDWHTSDGSVHYYSGMLGGFREYSPLTDDALCFQLMVKYGVELSPMFSGCWSATAAKVYTFDDQIDHRLCPTWLDDNPNKAICLAIIEANK